MAVLDKKVDQILENQEVMGEMLLDLMNGQKKILYELKRISYKVDEQGLRQIFS